MCFVSVAAQGLRFIALGDWGSDETCQYIVADAMGKWCALHRCDFIITTGDNFYHGGITSPDDPRFNTTWKDVYTHPSIIDLVWYIGIGNHDHHTENDGREWFQVEYGKTEPRWYFPDLTHSVTQAAGASSTVKFIFIDSQSLRKEKNDPDRMLEFLKDELQDPLPDWKIVVGHHAALSAGKKAGSGTMRDKVIPLMKQYNGDIYVAGHEHNLQHYQEWTGGVDHIITGGGGRKLHKYEPEHEAEMAELGGILMHFSESHGFVYFTIDDFSIRSQYLDTNLTTLYTYERFLK